MKRNNLSKTERMKSLADCDMTQNKRTDNTFFHKKGFGGFQNRPSYKQELLNRLKEEAQNKAQQKSEENK